MTCQIAGLAVSLEVPLARIEDGRRIRVGIRAGDICWRQLHRTGSALATSCVARLSRFVGKTRP